MIKSKVKAYLLIDAAYFPNDLCLVLYYDHNIRYNHLYRMTDKECYEQMQENLKVLGVNTASIICNGHKAMLKAIRKVYPQYLSNAVSFIHIKRQSQAWLTKNRKTPV